MLLLRNLSLRYKIPLRGTVLVIITAVLVTASLIFREYDELKGDLNNNAASMGRVLANTLVAPLVHDDVWRAFEIINSPFHAAHSGTASHGPEIVLVLDPANRIYVSTRPNEYPMLGDPARLNPDFRTLSETISSYKGVEPLPVEPSDSSMIYTVTPIVSDGVSLGALVMGYSKTMFVPRYYAIAKRAALVTLLVLAVLLPASWYWGQRFAVPLVQLAESMKRIGTQIPSEQELEIDESRDEVGQLGSAFKRMVKELREKESLEKEMLLSERLAAIGRLSAGIAHEINNPLGGMLNAINTFKRHGNPESAVSTVLESGDESCGRCDLPTRLMLGGKTLSLLERGLMQIKDTVAALLVEARVESHPLTPQDIEDTRTLVQADAHGKAANFSWKNDVGDLLPLPSTLVRQILINLLINAIQAIDHQGHVHCHIYRNSDTLFIRVKNDGRHIPSEHLEYLFEPFSSYRETGHGLGLWVTYQIVKQLNGEISVKSTPGETGFTVQLPFAAEAVAA